MNAFLFNFAESEEIVRYVPADRPIPFRKSDPTFSQRLSDPLQKHLLGAPYEDWRASQPEEGFESVVPGQFLREPAGPLGHGGQAKTLRNAVQQEHWVVIAEHGALPLSV